MFDNDRLVKLIKLNMNRGSVSIQIIGQIITEILDGDLSTMHVLDRIIYPIGFREYYNAQRGKVIRGFKKCRGSELLIAPGYRSFFMI